MGARSTAIARSTPVSTPACVTWIAGLAHLFSGLWLFHAPFFPGTAVAIFDPQTGDAEDERSPIYDRLHTLWQRSLLTLETATLREGTVQLYRVLPTIRPYIEKYLAQVDEREGLLAGFGEAYAQVVRYLYDGLDRGGVAAFIAFQSREDLERGASCVMGLPRGYYLLDWAWVLQRLGDTRRGLKLTEQALGIGQGQDRQLEMLALNNMAKVYQATGQPKRALELYEQALPLMREVGDRAGEARTLANLAALLYQHLNRSQEAITRMEQAIAVLVETGLTQDAAGQTRDQLQQYLDAMRQGISPGQAIGGSATKPAAQLQVMIVTNTVAVMTTVQERRSEWRTIIADELLRAKQEGDDWQIEVEFYSAVLALLDGLSPALPGDHPYATALAKIQEGIAEGGQ